jgi:hypothetical protein
VYPHHCSRRLALRLQAHLVRNVVPNARSRCRSVARRFWSVRNGGASRLQSCTISRKRDVSRFRNHGISLSRPFYPLCSCLWRCRNVYDLLCDYGHELGMQHLADFVLVVHTEAVRVVSGIERLVLLRKEFEGPAVFECERLAVAHSAGEVRARSS